MITLLAAITAQSLVSLLVQVIVVALICWLLWWLVAYIGLPEPFNKIARVVIAIIAVLFLINALLSLAGKPFITW